MGKNEILNFKIRYKNKNYSFEFHKAGKHNIYNAMAAIITALENGLSFAEVQRGLAQVEFSSNRMDFIELKSGVRIINDSYNANPLAVKAAIDVLMDHQSKRTIAVLASMLELGEQSQAKHREVGLYAAKKDVDLLVTIGSEAGEIAAGAGRQMPSDRIITLKNNQECIEFLAATIKKDDLILIKGSRANHLEEIAAALKTEEL